MKKLFLFISMVSILMTLFTINVLAKDVEIGKCDTSDPICVALQEKYGIDSTVLYSTAETTTCVNQLTVNVNGEDRIVYVSAKPASDDEVVAPPPVGNENQGTLPDDGIVIKPGDTGINEIVMPKPSFNLNSNIHSVNNSKESYPYNELNKKLIYVFGSSLYYFSEDEYEQVKTLLINAPQWWKESYMQNGIDAWIDDNFYKTTVEVIDEYDNKISKVLYLSIEPTDDQRMVLKMDPTNHKNTESKVSIQQTVIIAVVVVALCGVVMMGGYCLIKRLKKLDTTQH